MKNFCYSTLNDCYYLYDGCIKIINLSQALFYVDNNVPIKDIYPSINYQTGKRTLVFIVDKFESGRAYNQWKKLQGQKRFDCRNYKEKIDETVWQKVTDPDQVIYYLDHKLHIKEITPIRESEGRFRLAFLFLKEEAENIYEQWINSH